MQVLKPTTSTFVTLARVDVDVAKHDVTSSPFHSNSQSQASVYKHHLERGSTVSTDNDVIALCNMTSHSCTVIANSYALDSDVINSQPKKRRHRWATPDSEGEY